MAETEAGTMSIWKFCGVRRVGEIVDMDHLSFQDGATSDDGACERRTWVSGPNGPEACSKRSRRCEDMQSIADGAEHNGVLGVTETGSADDHGMKYGIGVRRRG